MMVRIYNYTDGLHDIRVDDDKVVVKAKGSESYPDSGGHMNERNVTLDVELTHEQVLEAAEQIQDRRWGIMDEDNLKAVREIETKPGYQVVIRTEEGEYIEAGPNPWIFVGPMEDGE